MNEKNQPRGPRPVFWAGTVPDICDMCGNPIASTFVDARLRPSGSWGCVDRYCHRVHGVGVGTGKGQVYQKQADGRWLKTDG